jgi:Fe-Mn family superoxide dismutase
MACDVWEHRACLHSENRRPEHLKAFWDVVQWEAVSNRFEEINGKSMSESV